MPLNTKKRYSRKKRVRNIKKRNTKKRIFRKKKIFRRKKTKKRKSKKRKMRGGTNEGGRLEGGLEGEELKNKVRATTTGDTDNPNQNNYPEWTANDSGIFWEHITGMKTHTKPELGFKIVFTDTPIVLTDTPPEITQDYIPYELTEFRENLLKACYKSDVEAQFYLGVTYCPLPGFFPYKLKRIGRDYNTLSKKNNTINITEKDYNDDLLSRTIFWLTVAAMQNYDGESYKIQLKDAIDKGKDEYNSIIQTLFEENKISVHDKENLLSKADVTTTYEDLLNYLNIVMKTEEQDAKNTVKHQILAIKNYLIPMEEEFMTTKPANKCLIDLLGTYSEIEAYDKDKFLKKYLSGGLGELSPIFPEQSENLETLVGFLSKILNNTNFETPDKDIIEGLVNLYIEEKEKQAETATAAARALRALRPGFKSRVPGLLPISISTGNITASSPPKSVTELSRKQTQQATTAAATAATTAATTTAAVGQTGEKNIEALKRELLKEAEGDRRFVPPEW